VQFKLPPLFSSHSANLDGKENPIPACCNSYAIDFNGKTVIIDYYPAFHPCPTTAVQAPLRN
jgi:hypothetical protein